MRTAFHRRVALRVKTLQNLLEKGRGRAFGILTSYRGNLSKSQNQARYGMLIADLQRAGYRKVTPLRGKWEGVSEKAVLVPNINPRFLFDLGRKYEQDSVIYKSPDGIVGMYYTTGPAKAEVAVTTEGDAAFEIAESSNLYSKARGLSFEFGFLWGQDIPWNGSSPITRDQMHSVLERRITASTFKDRLREFSASWTRRQPRPA